MLPSNSLINTQSWLYFSLICVYILPALGWYIVFAIICYEINTYILVTQASLRSWDRLGPRTLLVVVLYPISRSASKFGIVWGTIKINWSIATPPSLLYTQIAAASHSPKWNWITWGNIAFIPLGVLQRHTSTASDLLLCIRITRGIIKTKTFNSSLEGSFVIEGQPHLNPHQNYSWCDSLVR